MIANKTINAKNKLSDCIATDVIRLNTNDSTNERKITKIVHLCEVETFESGFGTLNFFLPVRVRFIQVCKSPFL